MDEQQMKDWLHRVVSSSDTHAKWLNTLSYLENCGARKIAACEHPTMVRQEVLKHAAEEFRHAYHLKRQMRKIMDHGYRDYSKSCLIGKAYTRQYLNRLDVAISSYIVHDLGLRGDALRSLAYLLVTYAIEVRASLLYPLYQSVLDEVKSPVSMRPIIAEEDAHLRDILAELSSHDNRELMIAKARDIEGKIFSNVVLEW